MAYSQRSGFLSGIQLWISLIEYSLDDDDEVELWGPHIHVSKEKDASTFRSSSPRKI